MPGNNVRIRQQNESCRDAHAENYFLVNRQWRISCETARERANLIWFNQHWQRFRKKFSSQEFVKIYLKLDQGHRFQRWIGISIWLNVFVFWIFTRIIDQHRNKSEPVSFPKNTISTSVDERLNKKRATKLSNQIYLFRSSLIQLLQYNSS